MAGAEDSKPSGARTHRRRIDTFVMQDGDDFRRWLAWLRERVACGNLAGVGPIHLHDGSQILPADMLIRVMLADLDHLDGLSPDCPEQASIKWRQQRLIC